LESPRQFSLVRFDFGTLPPSRTPNTPSRGTASTSSSGRSRTCSAIVWLPTMRRVASTADTTRRTSSS